MIWYRQWAWGWGQEERTKLGVDQYKLCIKQTKAWTSEPWVWHLYCALEKQMALEQNLWPRLQSSCINSAGGGEETGKKHFYFQSAIHYLKQLCADLHRQSVATIERNEMIRAVQSARVVVLLIFHKKSSKMSHFISCRGKIVTCAFVHWK